MTHLHKRSGQSFEVGSYISSEDNRTYDMTIITYWKDPEQETVGPPVELVGFYFGDYNEHDTDFYIDSWLDNRTTEIDVLVTSDIYLKAYLLTNYDVLEQSAIDKLEQVIGDCQGLIHDRSWKFELKKKEPPQMTRAEYLRYIEELYAIGKIDDDAMDALCMLSGHYPDK